MVHQQCNLGFQRHCRTILLAKASKTFKFISGGVTFSRWIVGLTVTWRKHTYTYAMMRFSFRRCCVGNKPQIWRLQTFKYLYQIKFSKNLKPSIIILKIPTLTYLHIIFFSKWSLRLYSTSSETKNVCSAPLCYIFDSNSYSRFNSHPRTFLSTKPSLWSYEHLRFCTWSHVLWA